MRLSFQRHAGNAAHLRCARIYRHQHAVNFMLLRTMAELGFHTMKIISSGAKSARPDCPISPFCSPNLMRLFLIICYFDEILLTMNSVL